MKPMTTNKRKLFQILGTIALLICAVACTEKNGDTSEKNVNAVAQAGENSSASDKTNASQNADSNSILAKLSDGRQIFIGSINKQHYYEKTSFFSNGSYVMAYDASKPKNEIANFAVINQSEIKSGVAYVDIDKKEIDVLASSESVKFLSQKSEPLSGVDAQWVLASHSGYEHELLLIEKNGNIIFQTACATDYFGEVFEIEQQSDGTFLLNISQLDEETLFKIDLVHNFAHLLYHKSYDRFDKETHTYAWEDVKPIVSKSDFIGKTFNYPLEAGEITIHENKTIFDSGIKYDGQKAPVIDEVTSKIVTKERFTILQTDKQDYIVFDCEVDGIEFLSLLKPMGDGEFYLGNWEMPYTKTTVDGVYSSMAMIRGVEFKSASSYLTETVDGKVINYIPKTDRTSNWSLWNSIPLAVSKNAVEKIIRFTVNWKERYDNGELPPSNLIISNGFVSAEKPYLYEQNCRAKTIRLTCNGKSETYVLEDTPNFQVLPLASLAKPAPDDIFELEIIDWYDGSKYDDIVISALQYVSVKVK